MWSRMMFVTPVLRTRREVQHTFLKAMEAKVFQGGQCTDFVSRSMGDQQGTIIAPRRHTERRAGWWDKPCCRTLFRYMNSNTYQYILYSSDSSVFQHCVFHWWEFQFPIFDTPFCCQPGESVVLTDGEFFALKDTDIHRIRSGRLRNPAIESHESRWKWLQQGQKHPEVKVANALLMHC